MTENNRHYFELENEVHLWIEQEASICLKAISAYGDPVELTTEQAKQIVSAMQEMIDKLEC